VTDGLADPFDTAGVRARVLDAWAASPSRFREDANAEEDYALGGYRDRVVVELAQNAADAAVRGGVPGRLRLTLRDGVLVALNTGAPLDAAGVEALSTLRASSKRGDAAGGGTVGRFGVGFAAVVAVSDSPRIRSATGAVGWSRTRTAELAAAVPALAGEIGARSGHVPVLRLPFADQAPSGADGAPPEGFVTAVELPLRDDAAVELVTRLLAETGPALLLALPALTHVEITAGGTTRLLTAVHDGDRSTITVNGVPSAWLVAGAGGELDQALLADRPAEERVRTWWSVRWAVPVNSGPVNSGPVNSGPLSSGPVSSGPVNSGPVGDDVPTGRLPLGVTAVVHAPTPTDEPLSLPALLLASFPLSPDRRHVAPGPLTNFLIERAADAYAGLLPDLAPGPGLLDLVPGPVGQGELDARLARAIVARLPAAPFLPAVGGDPEADVSGALVTGRVRPRDALLLATSAAGLSERLAPVLPNLVAGPLRHPAWAVLGVRRMPLAELADLLASLDREPAWWHGLYTALGGVPAEERAELGALPVPLADGRLVRGPRGLLLPGQGLEHADRLAVLGLRVVHPEAAHPLLARLGAVEATPRSVLEDPATRAAVKNSYDSAVEAGYDDDSPPRVADAVLGLLAALDVAPGEYPWLAELALPGEDGDWYPAGELLLPGAPLAAVIAEDAPFGTVGADLVERHGAEALRAAGVLWSFGVLTAEDVELDESQIDVDLDGADEWAADTRDRLRPAGDGLPPLPPVAVEFTAVRDLDLVGRDRWPQALDLLTSPPLRAAFTEPTRVRLPDGRHADVPSYTAWWLRHHVTLGGRHLSDLRAADADPLLAGLYDPVTVPGEANADPALTRVLADPAIARALGVRSSLTALLAEPGGADELLSRLADPARGVTRPQLRALWSALAITDGVRPDDITPPDRIRAVHGDKIIVTEAADVLILDAPDLWPLVADQPLLLAPYRHATRLADLLDLPLAAEEVPGVIESAGERRPVPDIVPDVLPGAPATYHEHDNLTVDGTDVPWRYAGGQLHAATVEGLAHGLAWAAGRWQDRHLLAALLISPEETARLLVESDLDT
jgi:antitoxin (DNA-binding transcriptional repressor) of toxin-antitoxin stability system